MQSQFSGDHLFDLSYEGLTPVISLSSTTQMPDNPDSSMPLSYGKTIQWPLILSENISKIFMKLGTCGRINHCQLVLAILQEQTIVAKATLDGSVVQDNQWATFVLEHPLISGEYLCQLHSPDADDLNTVFVWLTTTKSELTHDYPGNLLNLDHYNLTPTMKLPFEPESQEDVVKSIPLSHGKTIQWSVNWQNNNTISNVFLKLGTCDRLNQCQLVLSILQEEQKNQTIIAKAILDGTLTEDNEWTEFILDNPIESGKYWCQLQSPDADDHNTLFLWLTMAK
ncbi:hypothetical protein [Candidatus Parabeggiatoa sp. HSG14]|uniref:hypothetical protein n=1 Tax=Candidatus Parabeggiatoa sp. HSG14 TaxID=3055593 RepID=UPI0025A864B2|nr:hypothetical protein [Thiotrichales bacterium HSG14]